jgi:hypothetical protein
MTSSIVNVAETFGLSEDMSMQGKSPLVRRQYSPRRKAAIVEAANLWKRTFDGDPRAGVLVKEALSTSDLFKVATGDVLDRELLAQYAALQPEWMKFATRTTVRNFKPKSLVDILRGRSALDRVPELMEYPQAGDYDQSEVTIQVNKFGRRFGFSWEAQVNDDLGELEGIPQRFADAAARTEDEAAFGQFVDFATGAPNTAYFKAGNGNTPATAALTLANLATAIATVKQKTDPTTGDLVPPDNGLILVVGPAQEQTARNILSITTIRETTGSTETERVSPVSGQVELVVLNKLKGDAWFILPKPGGARPALVVAFLRGWETPDIRMKSNPGVTPSGGNIDPMEGDFDDDSVWYRVRHVTGAAAVDPLHTYASDPA